MKAWSLVSFLAPVALLAAQVAAYANPEACSGACWTHDPSVMRRSDGTYFRFATGSLIGIWKASSLDGPWDYQGAAIPAGSKIDLAGNNDLWAPDVQKIGSQYVMFYAVSVSGSQSSAIGYATSSTMEYGSWTDHGATGIASSSSKPYNAIDPNLISAGSDYYLTFGSFWGDLYQVEMDSAGTQVASGASVNNVVLNTTGSRAVEGGYAYERSGYYYVFFSSGECCNYNVDMPAAGEEYKIFVCRSKSVTGPYVDKEGVACTGGSNGGTLVLASHGNVYGPGGQGVFDDPTHGSVMYYHYADKSVGMSDSEYQFGWNTLTWSDGWPSV